MYDCGGPTLVFVTQTHHPLLEHHTGYIFAMYEFHYHKPRELFFQYIAEAQVFALYADAKLEMDPDAAPQRMSALEFVACGEDDSRFAHVPDLRTNHVAKRKKLALLEYEANMGEPEPEPVVGVELDWFGGDDA